jgi:hypothetical protein
MWYEIGYSYTRTRRELEFAAAFKCIFCKEVASHDGKYRQDSQSKDEVSFDEPRPEWYPSRDEEIKLEIRYNWVDNILLIRCHGGIDQTLGDISWGMYTTAGEFCYWIIPFIVQDVHKAQTTQPLAKSILKLC